MSQISLGAPFGSSSGAGPSKPGGGSRWVPLPYIHSGFLIHPHRPHLPPDSPTSRASGNFRNRYSWSGMAPTPESPLTNGHTTSDTSAPGSSKKKPMANVFELIVDIGDEFFAFEEYRCSPEEDNKGDTWYRGDLVPSYSLPPPYTSPRADSQVMVGIIPSSILHVRPGAVHDDGTLLSAFEEAVRQNEARDSTVFSPSGMGASWSRELEGVQEEDEDVVEGYTVNSPTVKSERGEVIDVQRSEGQLNGDAPPGTGRGSGSSGIARASRPKSLILPPSGTAAKPQAPVPNITAGDSTIAGQAWPLIDEVACAIREWSERLPIYLANREYRLFDIVMQHIDALLIGRRQMLAQTHSEDELAQVRKECISRLVKCNVAQGLEVIVRSFQDGSVCVVDPERHYVGSLWINGIQCYSYQVQLAYIDVVPIDNLFTRSSSSGALLPQAPSSSSIKPFSLAAVRSNTSQSPALGSFHHLFLDVKAFIASPCGPGETAELFFSLYNSSESRFITEEFCLILNELGSPARDSENRLGRMRTLFTELKAEDFGSGSTVYIVCRIVKNGAFSVRSGNASSNGDQFRQSTIRTAKSIPRGASDYGTIRSTANASILDDATDDSFSITSSYGPQRTTTIETSRTIGAADNGASFRRPFGCAVLELPQLAKLLAENPAPMEFTMSIYVPREEGSFATLHEEIIQSRTKSFLSLTRAESMVVSLKAFKGVSSQLIREHPSLLQDAPVTARLGFPDVVFPGTTRNDIYVKLVSGFFSLAPAFSGGSIRGRKSLANAFSGDVQVSMELRRTDGAVISDSISIGGSGEPPVTFFNSTVFHNTDRPAFGELIKLSLPSQTTECHLFLTFRVRSKDRAAGPNHREQEKPFAFAYLPILSSLSCIHDAQHELYLYHAENNAQPAPLLYFQLPPSSGFDADSPSGIAGTFTALRDRVYVRTYLCSSLHTSDETLRSLFEEKKVRSDPETLQSILQRFNFVNEQEIAKFIPATLDALFGVMVSNFGDGQEQMDDLVFTALVKVLAMSSDRRFSHFDQVLSIYTSTQFSFPASSFHLLQAVRKTMADPSTKEYRSFIKVWHLVFQFIVRARSLDRGIGLDATSAHIEADFKRQTRGILTDINTLMLSTDKALIGTQTLAVQHYADILPYLSGVFQPPEIADIVIAFTDTLNDVKGTIALHKLSLVHQTIRSTFDTAESRAILVPAMVRWVKPHLGRFDDFSLGSEPEPQSSKDSRRVKWLECNRLAVSCVASMVEKLQEWSMSPLMQDDEQQRAQEQDNLEYCLNLIPSMVASYHTIASAETAAALARVRATASSTIWKETADIFPSGHSFALMAQLPPSSLIDRQLQSEDGLSTSGTFIPGQAEIAAVLLSLIFATAQEGITRWLLETLDIEDTERFSATLIAFFSFAKSVLHHEAFPAKWLNLSLMAHGAIVRFLHATAPVLELDAFIPPISKSSEFSPRIWTECFELLCDIGGSDALALEEHSHQRRRAGWMIAGDLREEGTALLVRFWNKLGWPVSPDTTKREGEEEQNYGGYQTRFTGLAQRILGLCLSGHDDTCRSAVEILYSMIYAEFILKSKFDTIETEIFSKLDKIFSSTTTSSIEPAARAWFITELRQVHESTPKISAEFEHAFSIFLESIELFIALLESMRDLPPTLEFADERASATYQMLDFVKKIGREGLYIQFIHQLKRIFLDNKDWTNAAYALKLHADVYDWTPRGDLVDQCREEGLILPAQTPFARKEAIYYHALEYLAEGEAYEAALELTNELVHQHQTHTYNISRLSALLHYQARLWERIGQAQRQNPEYFRVAYYGDFKPSIYQGKDFIVRGRPWQRFSDFCDLVQSKYPFAQLHTSKLVPQATSTTPIIWITSVSPEPEHGLAVFSEGVNPNIADYYRHNDIKRFMSFRPYKIHSPPLGIEVDGGDVSAVMTWLEKTTITTRESLPGILNRSEIVNVEYEHISPVMAAVVEVEKATRTLRHLAGVGYTQPADIKHLGTAINGAVDSPVSGGVKLYRAMFLNSQYATKYPAEADDVAKLQRAVLDYARAIQEGLVVHGRECKDTAFHEALKSHFIRAFPAESAALPRVSDTLAASREARNSTSVPGPAVPPKTDLSLTTYSLPPMRIGPSPQASYTSPIIPQGTSPSPIKSPRSHPATPTSLVVPTTTPTLHLNGNGLSALGLGAGSRRQSSVGDDRDTDGTASILGSTMSASTAGAGSTAKKANRLSRLGSLMRRNK